MIGSLPLFHRIAGTPVIVLGTGEAAEARRRLVERAGGAVVTDFEQGIAQGARLAFVAMVDPQQLVDRLRGHGLLVNVADRPEFCDFTVPSLLDRSPVLIAIGTGGASAGLAKALRLRLDALLPASLGRLADALGNARDAMRARWPAPGERRLALDAALGEGGALDPLRAGSETQVDAWLTTAQEGAASEIVEIRLASSDPDDLTVRQARTLGSADLLVHEEGVPAAILDRGRSDAARVVIAPGEAPPAASGHVVVLRGPAGPG